MSIQPQITKVFRQRRHQSLKRHISPIEYELNNSAITHNSIGAEINKTSSLIHQNAWEDKYSLDQQRCMNSQEESNHNTDLNTGTNEIGSLDDHHRKKKRNRKKCRRICLYVFLCIVLVCIIITTILAVLLTKMSATTTTRSSSTVYLRWNSSGITIAGQAGISGNNSNLLYRPYGLAFDSSSTLYIVDYYNHRVQKLITGTSNCITVAGIENGTYGNAANQLYRPSGIFLDSNDNMYITDRGNARIQFWAKGATSGTTIAGINGTLNISLLGPTSVVSDSNSATMYISDTGNHRIVSYPTGTVVAGGKNAGNNNTQLYNPFGLVYDVVSKSFVISNYNTNNIVRWVLDATNRIHLLGNTNGSSGVTSTSLNRPVGLTMDPMGNIYVADSDNHRIQLFLAGQSDATTVAGITGSPGTNSSQLYYPYWVILDNQLNLYVSDTDNYRVQKFQRY